MRVPGEVEHELFVALGLARTTLARHAYALVAAGAAHLHKGSLGDGVEVRRALVEVLQERGLSVGVERAGVIMINDRGVGEWLQGTKRLKQAGLLCKTLCCHLAVEPVHQLERVDGHEYPACERVDLVLGEAYPRVV